MTVPEIEAIFINFHYIFFQLLMIFNFGQLNLRIEVKFYKKKLLCPNSKIQPQPTNSLNLGCQMSQF